MGLSLDEFRSALLNPEIRQSLGIQLTDAEAQQVVADPQASQNWFAYWQSLAQPSAPAQDAVPAAQEDAPVVQHPTDHPAEQGAPTAAFAAAPPAYQAPTEQPAPAGYDSAPAAPAATAAYLSAGPGSAPFETPGAGPYAQPSDDSAPAKKKRTGLWIALSIVGALLIAAIIVVVLAFTTARHWTKTDVAEKPETFHTEEYETGLYNVTDDGVSPCVVNQDWTECADAMEAQYAGACADVELTVMAEALCGRHRAEIDRMRSLDQEGYYVSALGGFGKLTRTPETATREVSNEDYEPAVTHEAVCYFEFIGECE